MGVGAVTASRLEIAGIDSVAKLAKAEVEHVVLASGFPASRAGKVIAAAAELDAASVRSAEEEQVFEVKVDKKPKKKSKKDKKTKKGKKDKKPKKDKGGKKDKKTAKKAKGKKGTKKAKKKGKKKG